MGVLISLQPPTGPMEAEAASAGFYTHKMYQQHYARLQLRTVKELMEGKGMERPSNAAAVDETFKKARKAKGKVIMSEGQQVGQESPLLQPASEAGAVIRDHCRAARIGEVTEFAECQAKSDASCPHRFAFNAYLYCVHPQREAIIARRLARQMTSGFKVL